MTEMVMRTMVMATVADAELIWFPLLSLGTRGCVKSLTVSRRGQSAVMTLSLKTTLKDPGRVLVVLSGTGGPLDTGLEDSSEGLNMTMTRHTHT